VCAGLGAVILASACARKETTPVVTTPDIIPRSVLFGNPERAGVQISPDGTRLAWLAPVDGVLNVWVAPIGDLAAAKAVTNDTGRGIRVYFWSVGGQHILYAQDQAGDENWRVYSADLTSGEHRDLTPLSGVRAQLEGTSEKFPSEILVGLNDRDPRFHDLYRIDIATGSRTLVQQNEGFAGFVADEDFVVRLGLQPTADGGFTILQKDGDSWKPYGEIGSADSLTTRPLGYDATGATLYMVDSRGRDTAALTSTDVATGESKVLLEAQGADVDNVFQHPTEKIALAASATRARQAWTVLDERVRADFEALAKVADGEMAVGSTTQDFSKWVVSFLVSDGPVRYYLWDHRTQKAEFLFTNRPALEDLPLAKMLDRTIASRDGLELVSYLTLPVESDPDGDGVPSEPLPMVLLVHGGPWARSGWGLDAQHQWLANRGYAVLDVNFRGSTGFGKAFTNAGNQEWAKKMHDDLLDAVQWAVDAKVAKQDKVAIMGGSYGGYATLVGLTFTPETFACGVDIVGPSNLVTLLESIPPYWAPILEMFASRVGDPRTEEGRALLTERSPLTRVDAIQRPLLIGQGANDPRVKQQESDQIVAAMEAKSIPVTYVLYPDEGHGFARPNNRMSFYAVTDAFLGGCLGGRVEPIGDDFEGSSIQVKAGASAVPGLEAALPAPAAEVAAEAPAG
jgi:dipeptidyl aminopeptidase/acylaminoacyl peptidase